MLNNQQLGRRLRLVRQAAALTQEDLAEKISLYGPTVSKIEAGSRPIRAEELVRWCLVCKVNPSEVLDSSPLSVTETEARPA